MKYLMGLLTAAMIVAAPAQAQTATTWGPPCPAGYTGVQPVCVPATLPTMQLALSDSNLPDVDDVGDSLDVMQPPVTIEPVDVPPLLDVTPELVDVDGVQLPGAGLPGVAIPDAADVDAYLELLADYGDQLDAATNVGTGTSGLALCPADNCSSRPADNRSTWYIGTKQQCAYGDGEEVRDQDNRAYWSNQRWTHKRGNEWYNCSGPAVKSARVALLNEVLDVVSGTYHSANNVDEGYGVGGSYGKVRKGYAGCHSSYKKPSISAPAMYQYASLECIYQYGK